MQGRIQDLRTGASLGAHSAVIIMRSLSRPTPVCDVTHTEVENIHHFAPNCGLALTSERSDVTLGMRRAEQVRGRSNRRSRMAAKGLTSTVSQYWLVRSKSVFERALPLWEVIDKDLVDLSKASAVHAAHTVPVALCCAHAVAFWTQ